jgi:hypothetical protein
MQIIGCCGLTGLRRIACPSDWSRRALRIKAKVTFMGSLEMDNAVSAAGFNFENFSKSLARSRIVTSIVVAAAAASTSTVTRAT